MSDILHAITQGLLYPDIILLILFIGYALFCIGSIVAEFYTERKHFKVAMPKFLAALMAAQEDEIPKVIEESGLLKRQKLAMLTVYDYRVLPGDALIALIKRLVSEEESRYDRITGRNNMAARVSPMLGLMGTLIPLGPGIEALGRADTAALSSSLLIAFDTTVAGLVVAAVCLVIGKIRGNWYGNYMSALDSGMATMLEKIESMRAEGKIVTQEPTNYAFLFEEKLAQEEAEKKAAKEAKKAERAAAKDAAAKDAEVKGAADGADAADAAQQGVTAAMPGGAEASAHASATRAFESAAAPAAQASASSASPALASADAGTVSAVASSAAAGAAAAGAAAASTAASSGASSSRFAALRASLLNSQSKGQPEAASKSTPENAEANARQSTPQHVASQVPASQSSATEQPQRASGARIPEGASFTPVPDPSFISDLSAAAKDAGPTGTQRLTPTQSQAAPLDAPASANASAPVQLSAAEPAQSEPASAKSEVDERRAAIRSSLLEILAKSEAEPMASDDEKR